MVLLIGDIHFGTRNSNEFYLNKQEIFIKYLFKHIEQNKNEIESIIFLGDLLENRRSTNIIIQNKIYGFLEKLETFNIKCYFLLGNHDVYYKNTNNVNGLTPILRNYKNLNIVDSLLEVNTKNNNFLLTPWVNSENFEEIKNKLDTYKNPEEYYLLGHFDFNEITNFGSNDYGFLNVGYVSKFKHVFSGHYHLHISRENITYVGSILDFKWAEELSNHGIYEVTENDYYFIENPFDNIHQKYIINNQEELECILLDCENKEIKIVLTENFQMENDDKYDKIIYEIDEKCNSFQVLLANNIFDDSQGSEIKSKTFDEFVTEYIEDKTFDVNIDNDLLINLFLKLYKKANNNEDE